MTEQTISELRQRFADDDPPLSGVATTALADPAAAEPEVGNRKTRPEPRTGSYFQNQLRAQATAPEVAVPVDLEE